MQMSTSGAAFVAWYSKLSKGASKVICRWGEQGLEGKIADEGN